MTGAAIRHPIATWALAWGSTGAALMVSDVFSSPRRGPLWVTLAVGVVAWAIAGAATAGGERSRVGAVVWSVAFLATMWLGNLWGDWFEHNTVAGMSSAGFVGMLLGLSAAAGIAGCVSAGLWLPGWPLGRSLLLGLSWAGGFLFGGYAGLVAGYVIGGLTGVLLPWPAFIIGWGAGCALGGLVASGIGIKVRDALLGAA
jgi:hypothetical protein